MVDKGWTGMLGGLIVWGGAREWKLREIVETLGELPEGAEFEGRWRRDRGPRREKVWPAVQGVRFLLDFCSLGAALSSR